jgi:hypothetical protein
LLWFFQVKPRTVPPAASFLEISGYSKPRTLARTFHPDKQRVLLGVQRAHAPLTEVRRKSMSGLSRTESADSFAAKAHSVPFPGVISGQDTPNSR